MTYDQKRKRVKKKYDKLKPYIKAKLVLKYLSIFYGRTLSETYFSDVLRNSNKVNNRLLDEIEGVIGWFDKNLDL